MQGSFIQLPRTCFGRDAATALAEELARLGVRRPLLVTDRGLVKAGVIAKVGSGLAACEPMAIFDAVTENPLFADVEAAAKRFAQEGCDAVVAVGGGSVIDTAKFVALLATNGGQVDDYVGPGGKEPRRCAPLVVVPTTAGTGSEVSPDAGIHPDPATASTGMRSRQIVPDVAILDPELTVTLPPRLSAATGIDALSHCIEGYLSADSTPVTDAILLDAIARAIIALGRVVADGSDRQARTDMLWISYAGGIGIGMGLGPAHAVAIACGDQGFHHGVLSGIGLVCTLDAIAPYAPPRAAALRRALGISAHAGLSEAVGKMMRAVGLPATLAELGYRAADVVRLGKLAHGTPFNLTARHHFGANDFAGFIGQSLER